MPALNKSSARPGGATWGADSHGDDSAAYLKGSKSRRDPARVPAGLEGVSSIQQGRRVTLGGPRSLDLALSIEVAEVSFGLLFRQHRSAQFA